VPRNRKASTSAGRVSANAAVWWQSLGDVVHDLLLADGRDAEQARFPEPGTAEHAAAAVFESFSRIDPSFLERAKRRPADLISTLTLTQVEVSHKVDSCLTVLI
jgi:hypothetical protein